MRTLRLAAFALSLSFAGPALAEGAAPASDDEKPPAPSPPANPQPVPNPEHVPPPAPAAPVPGRSGTGPPLTPPPPVHYQSPQRFALEIKFGPYSPHIDQSAGLAPGATPFADLFNPQFDSKGNSTKGQQPGYRLLSTIEFDWQFLRRRWVNFGVGITTGFYRRTTHGFELNPDNTACTVPNCTRSGDEIGLNIVPLSALLVYRFDTLANEYKVPLVPYIKVGVAYYIWWMNNGGGFTSISQNPESAYGGTFGFVLNPGLALQLDFIERGVAKTLDNELGINHTYLFCELNYANINGFGASDKLNLSDTTFNAGFAIEF